MSRVTFSASLFLRDESNNCASVEKELIRIDYYLFMSSCCGRWAQQRAGGGDKSGPHGWQSSTVKIFLKKLLCYVPLLVARTAVKALAEERLKNKCKLHEIRDDYTDLAVMRGRIINEKVLKFRGLFSC